MQLINFLSTVLLITSSTTVHSTPLPALVNTRNPSSHPPKNTNACPNYCLNTNYNKTLTKQYICGDPVLGPARLPTKLPIFDLIDDYDRFGGLCPGDFLAKWYNATAKSYIYPSLDGFQVNTDGVPIKGNVTMEVGRLIDRFGSEFGRFVSPEGAPYHQRALPPSNLNTPVGDVRYPSNYHIYRIAKPFVALFGPITGWFGQPGQGVQYQLYNNIMELLAGGFITSVNFKDL